MSAGLLGSIALWGALGFAILALVTGRRWALTSSAVASWVATSVLGVALFMVDLSLEYVAETTSRATPWPYRLAAVWGGMDGSMLFYVTLLVTVGAVALVRRAEVRVAALATSLFLVVTLLYADPFTVAALPPVDGAGLLAILQHPAMIYHPPILYLGLVALLVPFARTVAGGHALDRVAWRSDTRRWLYLSWVLLTFGMAFGSNWAYVELGWGGFWAWDPVENTALIPWLAATVFIHTSRLEEPGERMSRWNVAFAGLGFAGSVIGVYLTRSGATGSIHSFAENPDVGRILLTAGAVAVGTALWVASRSQAGRPWGAIRLGRQLWLLTSGLLVALTMVFVTAGSVYPAFASVFTGADVAVDTRFFVVTVLPIATVIGGLLGVALRARWIWAGVGAILALIISAVVPVWGVATPLLIVAAGSLASVAVSLATRRPSGPLRSAHLGHLGMALFLVAVAGSSFGAEFSGSMVPGETVEVSGHTITLLEVLTGEGDRFVFAEGMFDVDGEIVAPSIRGYEEQAVPVAEPVVVSDPVDDVTIAMSLLFPDGETVAVSVFVRPLVWWVWPAAALMALAGVVALAGRAGGAATQRRVATTERPPAGTTT